MGDQINDQAVQLTAAAPVQLESFTLPAGTYPGVTRRSSDDSSGQMKSYKPQYFVVLTAQALSEHGEPVGPDMINQELDVTDLVGLGLVTVD